MLAGLFEDRAAARGRRPSLAAPPQVVRHGRPGPPRGRLTRFPPARRRAAARPGDGMDLVYCTGTRRCRAPGQTLELIGPLLGRFGITRLADITGLDCLGVPVAQAVRPAAATVAVSQGKGATRDAALVSAAMEAIELHHAEDAVPAPARTCPAADPRAGL